MTKFVVIGLDGVPFSLLQKFFAGNFLPNLKNLFKQGIFKRINAVIPTVSSVVWTSFSTGCNPGEHGVFGFVELDQKTNEMYIPLSYDIKEKSLWGKLSEQGKKIIVINVPLTYPPTVVNGILIGDFLSPGIETISFPKTISLKLKELGYRIDVDASNMRRGLKNTFFDDLKETLKKRFKTAFHFIKNESWDYFHLHVMETDRINHFLWGDYEKENNENADFFLNYYKMLDDYIGDFLELFPKNCNIVCLSDHGFCPIKKEVQLNCYLQKKGWLSFNSKHPKSLKEMNADSISYSLAPGRIYLRNKENYLENQNAIKRDLLEIINPENGERVIKKVYLKEELFRGKFLNLAPDLVVVPFDGYDLKARVGTSDLFENTELSGMHTFDDAFFFINTKNQGRNINSIDQVSKLILDLYEIGG